MVIISACDNLDDWAVGNGTLSLDTADFKEGAASIKNTGQGNGSGYVDAIYDPTGTWDWSAEDHLVFWFKATSLNSLQFRVYSGADIDTDYVEWTVQFFQQVLIVNKWYRVKLYKDDFDGSSGSISWAAVKALRIRAGALPSEWVDWRIDELLIDEYDPIKGKIGTAGGLNYVSDDVLEADIWGDDLMVGRWLFLLKNVDNKYGGKFHSNEAFDFKINTVSMMKGYVDDALPYLDDQGYYTNKFTVKGRDYGRDLARLIYAGGYVDTKGDDIMEAILLAKSSEITYTSPSTAAVVPIERGRTHLIDWFQDIAAALNFSGYVDQSKELKFFGVGTVSSGVAFKSIADDVTNNILHLLKGEEIGFSIANKIELSAGSLDGHWHDGNSADFDVGAGTTVANETTIKMAGLSSIKFSNAGAAKPAITLDFSGAGMYSHAGLDLSLDDTLGFWIRHNNSPERVMIKFILEDNAGKIIEFFRGSEDSSVSSLGKTLDIPVNSWHKIQINYGEHITLATGWVQTDKWYNTSGSGFDWFNVVKLTWQAVQMLASSEENLSATDFYLDSLTIPTLEVISLISDAVSIAAYDPSEWFEQRDDIRSQIELDVAAASELEKRKDPLKNIKIIAIGQTGIKYPGQTVTVQAPKHGLAAPTTYRIVSYHHQIRKDPIRRGHSFITTVDLVSDDLSPATQFIDPRRYMLNRDPVGAALEILALTRRRVRSISPTQRKQYGVTHPTTRVNFSGSGTTFPENPDDGFVFKLTADIASTHLAGDYIYDETTNTWIRGPAIFRRSINPTYGRVTGDINENTTDGAVYKWTGSTWERIDHGGLGGLSGDDHTQYLNTSRHSALEHLASMMAIETRPWTSNFNVSWDGSDYDKLYYGKGGAESTDDANISIAGVADLINQKTEDGVPDGFWYLYWDENEKTGDDYDVQRTDDILVATGVGKGLLAAVIVDESGSNPPAVNPMGGYTPTVSAGMMAARFITAGMMISNFVIGDLEIKTGAGVQWTAGGDPGVIITDLGWRGKGDAGAIMAEMLASNGKITAGGGTIILDSDGMTVNVGGQIYFFSSAVSDYVAQMVPYYVEPGNFGTVIQALNDAALSFATAGASLGLTHAGTVRLYGDIGVESDSILPRGAGTKMIGDINTPWEEGWFRHASLDISPASDHQVWGLTFEDTVGENVVYGDFLYLKTDGKWWKSDADAEASMPVEAMATETIAANASGVLLWQRGIARDDSWSWTPETELFASTTPGALTETRPSGSGDMVQSVAKSRTVTVIMFRPSPAMVEII